MERYLTFQDCRRIVYIASWISSQLGFLPPLIAPAALQHLHGTVSMHSSRSCPPVPESTLEFAYFFFPYFFFKPYHHPLSATLVIQHVNSGVEYITFP